MGWDVEKPVWWRAFGGILQQQPQDCGLLMTEALFNLPSIQASTMQVAQAPPDALVLTPLRGAPDTQSAPHSVLHCQYGASRACQMMERSLSLQQGGDPPAIQQSCFGIRCSGELQKGPSKGLPGASACCMAGLPCRWYSRSLASGPSWQCQLSR